MYKIILQRLTLTSETPTLGVLLRDNKALCVTLELPWLGNLPNISCIPAGLYRVGKYHSDKFPDTWEIRDVPDRHAILIHTGNSMNDVHGCIAVGTAFSGDTITSSKIAMNKLREILPDTFLLEINNPKEN